MSTQVAKWTPPEPTIDTERFAEQKASALSRVRDYNVWLVLQPSGNIYLTSHKRTASKCEVVLGVVRRGTDVYEPLAPPCWLPREEREPAPICERPTKQRLWSTAKEAETGGVLS
jgi:hypothetical protein